MLAKVFSDKNKSNGQFILENSKEAGDLYTCVCICCPPPLEKGRRVERAKAKEREGGFCFCIARVASTTVRIANVLSAPSFF
jgi:hypothetical protein